jgi:hypothetical protein
MSETMLKDAANFATAGVHDLQYWQNTIRPRCPKFQNVINNQFLKGTDIRVEFTPDELDVFQEDEAQRATSLQSLVNSKLPLRLAMEILGYDLTEEQWAMLEADEQRRQETAERIQGQIGGSQDDEEADRLQQQRDMADRQREDDLRKWQRLVLRRLSEGKAQKIGAFQSKFIPASLLGAISGRLEGVTSELEVKAIFAHALSNKAVVPWSEYSKREEEVRQPIVVNVNLGDGIKSEVLHQMNVPPPDMTPVAEAIKGITAATAAQTEAIRGMKFEAHVSPAAVTVTNEVKTPEVKVTNEVRMPKIMSRHEDRKLQRDSKQRVTGAKVEVEYHYEEDEGAVI